MEYDFNRALTMHPKAMGFRTWGQFRDHQRKIIEQSSEASIETLEFLRDKIVPMASTMDKESMVDFEAEGFCFSKDNRIVFFNER